MADDAVVVRMSRDEARELLEELRDPPIPPHRGLQTGALLRALVGVLEDPAAAAATTDGARLDQALARGEV